MPRRLRLHVPEGVYYIVLSSNPGRLIFSHAIDYENFEKYLAGALANCRVSAYAFVWQPDTVRLLVQITDISVGRFVQRLTAQYARSIHKQRGGCGHLFQQRYRAVIIDPEAYLPKFIHYVHVLQTPEVGTPGVDFNRMSSQSAYLGKTQVDWLTKAPALTPEAYYELMQMPLDPRDIKLFARGAVWDPRVVGGKEFYRKLLARPCVRENSGTLDQIIDTIALNLGLEREAVLSKSRHRRLALARALVTWHAIERGIGSLAEVARKLQRDPATLFVGVRRYRALRPELFNK